MLVSFLSISDNDCLRDGYIIFFSKSVDNFQIGLERSSPFRLMKIRRHPMPCTFDMSKYAKLFKNSSKIVLSGEPLKAP